MRGDWDARWTSSRLITPTRLAFVVRDRQSMEGGAAQASQDLVNPITGMKGRDFLLGRQELADVQAGQHLADVVALVRGRARAALDLRAVDGLLVGEEKGQGADPKRRQQQAVARPSTR